jgi:hypothetical protein
VVNQLGLMIRSTLEASLGKQYATLMSDLIRTARQSVAQLDSQASLLGVARLLVNFQFQDAWEGGH